MGDKSKQPINSRDPKTGGTPPKSRTVGINVSLTNERNRMSKHASRKSEDFSGVNPVAGVNPTSTGLLTKRTITHAPSRANLSAAVVTAPTKITSTRFLLENLLNIYGCDGVGSLADEIESKLKGTKELIGSEKVAKLNAIIESCQTQIKHIQTVDRPATVLQQYIRGWNIRRHVPFAPYWYNQFYLSLLKTEQQYKSSLECIRIDYRDTIMENFFLGKLPGMTESEVFTIFNHVDDLYTLSKRIYEKLNVCQHHFPAVFGVGLIFLNLESEFDVYVEFFTDLVVTLEILDKIQKNNRVSAFFVAAQASSRFPDSPLSEIFLSAWAQLAFYEENLLGLTGLLSSVMNGWSPEERSIFTNSNNATTADESSEVESSSEEEKNTPQRVIKRVKANIGDLPELADTEEGSEKEGTRDLKDSGGATAFTTTITTVITNPLQRKRGIPRSHTDIEKPIERRSVSVDQVISEFSKLPNFGGPRPPLKKSNEMGNEKDASPIKSKQPSSGNMAATGIPLPRITEDLGKTTTSTSFGATPVSPSGRTKIQNQGKSSPLAPLIPTRPPIISNTTDEETLKDEVKILWFAFKAMKKKIDFIRNSVSGSILLSALEEQLMAFHLPGFKSRTLHLQGNVYVDNKPKMRKYFLFQEVLMLAVDVPPAGFSVKNPLQFYQVANKQIKILHAVHLRDVKLEGGPRPDDEHDDLIAFDITVPSMDGKSRVTMMLSSDEEFYKTISEFVATAGTSVFQVELMTLAKRPDTIAGVPAVVRQAMAYLRERGVSEGIFRKSGIMTEIESLKQAYNQGTLVQLHKATDEHVVSGLFKLFFRELPIPLIPYSHYQPFVDLTDDKANHTDEQLVQCLKPLLSSLPKPHLDLLGALCKFLHEMATHKEITMMDYANLAIVFASNILKAPTETLESTMKYGAVNTLVEKMIANAIELFDASTLSALNAVVDNGKDETWLADLKRHFKAVKQQQEREEQRAKEREEQIRSLQEGTTLNPSSSGASPNKNQLVAANYFQYEDSLSERSKQKVRAVSINTTGTTKISSALQRKNMKKIEKIINPKQKT